MKSKTSKFLVAIAVLTLFSSCTSKEQQAQIDRQARIDKQEQQDADSAAKAEARAKQELLAKEATPEPSQTPEAPAESAAEPAKITYYYFTSTTEKTSVKCTSNGERFPCGIGIANCGPDGSDSYECQVGVHMWAHEE